MSNYTGKRTAHALQKARDFAATRSLDDEFDKAHAATKKFLETSGSVPRYALLANLCEASSHRNCTTIDDLEAIDWEKWSLATELRLLQWRLDAPKRVATSRMSWVEASATLHLGISLMLSRRETVGMPVLQFLAPILAPVLDQMIERKDRTRDWGALAYLFQELMDLKALPFPLRQTPPETLEQAIAARATYSDGRDPHGSLLSHTGAELIPVELVFFARTREIPNAELTHFSEKIRAVSYPDHPVFQEIDIALSTAGL